MNVNKTMILSFLGAFLLFSSPVSAHPGKVAADGCHYCRTNCNKWGVPWNERHCHGGTNTQQTQNPVSPTSTPLKKAITSLKQIVKKPTQTSTQQNALVTEVIDGDTLRVKINDKIEKVRLLAIDTPETKDPRKAVQCFGKEATKKMESLVTNKQVKLVPDKAQGDRDKYKRLLRYVYLDDGTFVNAVMVKEGYAFSYKKYPTKYLEDFNNLERMAREKNLGLWKACQ